MQSRGRILVDCSECGESQDEPELVVSTICKACGSHLEIEEGEVVPKQKFGTRLLSADELEAHKRAESELESQPIGESRFGRLLRVFSKPEAKFRNVICYHCGEGFQTISSALSSQCKRCGGYISLRDYTINQAWRRRIQTRGDVMIQREGSIVGVNVQCHHLTVLGRLAASVECSGDIRIQSHGRILGNVKCDELRVERGAEVEFQGEVHARTAYIDGELKAQLTCDGTITLEKKAHLKGLAKARGLVVKEGARHTGSMEVIRPGSD